VSADPRDELIAQLRAELAAALARIAELEAKLGQNSSNSSKPPSSDPPGAPPRRPRTASGRKRGGQPGHERQIRPLQKPDEVKEVKPDSCSGCQKPLTGSDPKPLIHQVTEIPRIQPHVTEYRLHALGCPCGRVTRAELPRGVPHGAFGPVLMATVALATSRFRQSKRLAQEFLSTILNVDLSTGVICKIEQQTSEAVAAPVEEAREYVPEQPVVNGDETGWFEGQAEGRKLRAWLWVATTPLVTVFLIAKSRGEAVARKLLGDEFRGLFGSDRWSAYDWLDPLMRQICWSHLIRDFQSWVDRRKAGAKYGRALLEQATLMFRWWHRVRDGTLQRATFERRMEPVRAEILRLLRKAEVCADRKTAGMAKAILKLEHALFCFVEEEGVDPTNNVSERRIRQGVILRMLTFGTNSARGSRYVERMLTVTTTLRQQERDVLGFLIEAHQARLRGVNAPSLFPA
jgi:transposase